MNETDFLKATEGTVPHRDVSVRQISNGFVLNGVVRYIDPATSQARVAIQSEAIAASAEQAGVAANTFLSSGKF